MTKLPYYPIVFLTLILILLGGCSTETTPTEEPIQYEIAGVNWYENFDNGKLYFNVVVKNIGNKAWNYAVVGIHLLDEKGAEIEECAESTLQLGLIPSGEYTYLLVKCKHAESFHNYSIDVLAGVSNTATVAADEEECVTGTIYARDLVLVETARESFGNYTRIQSTIVNASKLPLTGLQPIYIAIFDDEKLLDVDLCVVEFPTLEWKEQAPITCDITSIPQNAKLIWVFDGVFQCEIPKTSTP
jgi:hypothetical protein